MSRFEGEPHTLLRPYVASYWGFARDLTRMGRFAVTPDCFVELIFFADPPAVEIADALVRLPPCTLIPLLDEPLQLRTDGVVRCFAARLHAWAAGIVFPQTNVATEAWYDAGAAFERELPAIRGALERDAWPELVATLDVALSRVLACANPVAPGVSAVRAFVSPPGDRAAAATSDVAASEGRSRRQVERNVRSLTNRSPKQLVALTRFQFVRDALWAAPDTPLDRLALEAGYADQAHLTRQFRRFSGRSPTEFKRDCRRLARCSWARRMSQSFKTAPRPGVNWSHEKIALGHHQPRSPRSPALEALLHRRARHA